MEISALVVTFNEEKHLHECLQSLGFCDQIVVVDLGSTDRSLDIIRACNVECIHHARVPVVEELWPEIVPALRNDWVLRADPDEIFPAGLVAPLENALASCEEDIGIFALPYQYYFLGKPLRYTVWGGVRAIPKVFHRQRVHLHKRVHAGISPKEGLRIVDIPGDNAIEHYWVDSYRQLAEKHVRYLGREGVARFENGHRFSWAGSLVASAKALFFSLVRKNGWREGFKGWFLSLFYGWYEWRSWLALRSYERKTTGSPGKPILS